MGSGKWDNKAPLIGRLGPPKNLRPGGPHKDRKKYDRKAKNAEENRNLDCRLEGYSEGTGQEE
jgi:hypothetical protein